MSKGIYNNGLVHGGPMDGEIVESDHSYFHAPIHKPCLTAVNLDPNIPVERQAIDLYEYTKKWYMRDGNAWYDWY